ncbi:hypothetical protein ABMX62_20085 [Vibrio vulnificus]|uniref:hypothetical protein n=1 Tax=Vibrio vulnificus TaxID=672 RepID=UPI004059AA8C
MTQLIHTNDVIEPAIRRELTIHVDEFSWSATMPVHNEKAYYEASHQIEFRGFYRMSKNNRGRLYGIEFNGCGDSTDICNKGIGSYVVARTLIALLEYFEARFGRECDFNMVGFLCCEFDAYTVNSHNRRVHFCRKFGLKLEDPLDRHSVFFGLLRNSASHAQSYLIGQKKVTPLNRAGYHLSTYPSIKLVEMGGLRSEYRS